MTQDGIINNIINTFGIKGFNTSTTYTAIESPLETDAMKKPIQYQYHWKYSSVIIIIMYVTSNSCQNVSFSVHQFAKMNHNPKHLHEKGVLSICHYLQFNLKDGKSEGLFIRNSSKMTVHCYIYADFYGLYRSED